MQINISTVDCLMFKSMAKSKKNNQIPQIGSCWEVAKTVKIKGTKLRLDD